MWVILGMVVRLNLELLVGSCIFLPYTKMYTCLVQRRTHATGIYQRSSRIASYGIGFILYLFQEC